MLADNNSYIIIKVSETNKSYIFKLIENEYRYSPAQIDMLFSKSNKVTINKIKNVHAIREYDSWFVIYPFQSGIPFLFEYIDTFSEGRGRKREKEKKGGARVIVKIIETNLSISNGYIIKDHQNRIVEANSWEDYCRAFKEYNGESVEFKSVTKMIGNTIPKTVDISNLVCDEYHLSCSIWNGMFKTKKLAYLVVE